MDTEENTRISIKCFLYCKKKYRSWNGRYTHQRQKDPNAVVEMPERNLCSKGRVLAERYNEPLHKMIQRWKIT